MFCGEINFRAEIFFLPGGDRGESDSQGPLTLKFSSSKLLGADQGYCQMY
jgi:hypothetical protein